MQVLINGGLKTHPTDGYYIKEMAKVYQDEEGTK